MTASGAILEAGSAAALTKIASSPFTESEEFESKHLVNCAGLYSDKVTAMTQSPESKIVPFRGEYYEIIPEKRYLCKNLIYPVPDKNLPFLGVHFTRMIDGSVECGPNAVFTFKREGYGKKFLKFMDI